MFRDLKEYQEIAKIYAEKVSKPEDLEERVRGGGMSGAIKPFEKPSPQVSGQRSNRPDMKGGIIIKKPTVQGAQGRTKRPEPEIKKFPSTAEIRAANQGRSGGGNAGGSTDSGGTSQSTIKSVEQKPEIKKPDPKPMSTKDKFNSKFIKKDKGVGFVKRGTAVAQRAENKEKNKLRAQKLAKERLAKKNAMEEYTPYDFVLEYLLSTEQAATIEEANYVMTEMDAETIQGLVEEQKKKLDEVAIVPAVAGIVAAGTLGAMGINAIRKMNKNKEKMDKGETFKKGSTMDNIQKKKNMYKERCITK